MNRDEYIQHKWEYYRNRPFIFEEYKAMIEEIIEDVITNVIEDVTEIVVEKVKNEIK